MCRSPHTASRSGSMSTSSVIGDSTTVELVFDNVRVSTDSLVGGEEGRGYGQVLSALESGRINVAARAVGVATAAFEASIKYASRRKAFGKRIADHQAIASKLADMATKIEAARLLTYEAARKRDEGGRVDLEAGMAKLFASEVCGEVTMEAMRIHGGYGYIKEYPVERYYRDAPIDDYRRGNQRDSEAGHSSETAGQVRVIAFCGEVSALGQNAPSSPPCEYYQVLGYLIDA